jgi:oligo-1,6-glucosidase
MTNAPFARIEDFRDIESLNYYRTAIEGGADVHDVLASLRQMGRDNARTPMQWDATSHAGFTSGTPWIAVNPNYVEINAEAALAAEGSVFHHYRRLIALRHDEPVVAHGDFTMLLARDSDVYAFTRRLADVELLVLGNFSADVATAEVPSAADWAAAELLIANYPPYDDAPALVLRPWEARVYRRQV